MSYINYSMEVSNTNKVNDFFKAKYNNNELALEVMKDEIMTSNYKLENFYLSYKKELLSYKIKDLKKIFKDCSVKILHLIKSGKRKLVISRDHLEYLDYENNDYYYDMDNNYDLALSDYLENDIVFHTYVDELNKDKLGIYIILNGNKKYICNFERMFVYE